MRRSKSATGRGRLLLGVTSAAAKALSNTRDRGLAKLRHTPHGFIWNTDSCPCARSLSEGGDPLLGCTSTTSPQFVKGSCAQTGAHLGLTARLLRRCPRCESTCLVTLAALRCRRKITPPGPPPNTHRTAETANKPHPRPDWPGAMSVLHLRRHDEAEGSTTAFFTTHGKSSCLCVQHIHHQRCRRCRRVWSRTSSCVFSGASWPYSSWRPTRDRASNSSARRLRAWRASELSLPAWWLRLSTRCSAPGL